MIRLVSIFISAFFGALLFMVPNMARRAVFFTLNVAPDFRASPAGRRAVSGFRGLVAFAVLIDFAAIFFAPEEALGAVVVASPALVLLAAMAGFLRQKHNVGRFASQSPAPGVREADLSSEPDKIPWFAWFGAVPFAILAAAAAFLDKNWDRVPVRFPVHWNINGQPNRWADRTSLGVYGPLLFAAEFCAFLLALALAGWFGARRSRMRRIVLGTMIAVECMMALLFSGFAVNPVLQLPVWLIVLAPLPLMGIIVFVAVRRMTGSDGAAAPAPAGYWHAGGIYYNPGDPALLVEKPTGMGYTVNFGNHWSWVLTAGLVLIVASVRPLLL
jgi:uncharacterized membrane protein